MVLIRNDLLDRLPTPFFEKSSCEIPFATMFFFEKIHVMHSHLISRLSSAYENALCHFNTIYTNISMMHIFSNLQSHLRIKISVNTDISVIGFYGNIGNIGGYFYKNIGSIKIFHILII